MDQHALRARAEEIASSSDEQVRSLAPDEVRALLHELSVHQIELSLQNDEVLRTQRELQDLYDTAPVGLFTVDRRGIVQTVNRTLCRMLGSDRDDLVRRASVSMVTDEHRSIFFNFRDQLLKSHDATCKASFIRRGGEPLKVSLSGRRVGEEEDAQLRIAVTDISE